MPRGTKTPPKGGGLPRLRLPLPALGSTVDWFALALLSLCLFALASLATSWTGSWGRTLGNLLLASLGGASWVPLSFGVYVGALRLGHRPVPAPLRQSLGVLGLTLGVSLFLGLLQEAFPALGDLLVPGAWGETLGQGVLSLLGPLGATLTGIDRKSVV